MGKVAILHVRIEPEIKAALEAAAKMDARSLSGLMKKLIIDHCAKVGTLKQSQKDEPK